MESVHSPKRSEWIGRPSEPKPGLSETEMVMIDIGKKPPRVGTRPAGSDYACAVAKPCRCHCLIGSGRGLRSPRCFASKLKSVVNAVMAYMALATGKGFATPGCPKRKKSRLCPPRTLDGDAQLGSHTLSANIPTTRPTESFGRCLQQIPAGLRRFHDRFFDLSCHTAEADGS